VHISRTEPLSSSPFLETLQQLMLFSVLVSLHIQAKKAKGVRKCVCLLALPCRHHW